MNLSLNDLAKKIHEGNVNNGFYEGSDTQYFTSHQLLEVMKEVAEASEAHKKKQHADFTGYQIHKEKLLDMDTPEASAETQAFKTHIKDTFEAELCDALIRLLDLAAFSNINLDLMLNMVVYENTKRPRLHGKTY